MKKILFSCALILFGALITQNAGFAHPMQHMPSKHVNSFYIMPRGNWHGCGYGCSRRYTHPVIGLNFSIDILNGKIGHISGYSTPFVPSPPPAPPVQVSPPPAPSCQACLY